MHSTSCSVRSGQIASHSAPNPPRSPRQKMRSQSRRRASSSIAASAYGLAYGPPQTAMFGTAPCPSSRVGRTLVSLTCDHADRVIVVIPRAGVDALSVDARRWTHRPEGAQPMTIQTQPRIAILGAGPIGLEAALAAAERGWEFTVYEAGRSVGANVRDWGHVRLFTPWDMNVSPRARRALRAGTGEAPSGGGGSPSGGGLPSGGELPGGGGSPGGEAPSGGGLPTGAELAERLLEPLAALPALAGRVRLGT